MNSHTADQAKAMPATARWTSLMLAALTIALVIGGSAGLLLSTRGSVGWAVESSLGLLGGSILMGVATIVVVALARSVWRDEARPTAAITGLSLALLLAVAGTLVMIRAVAFFPGPLPVGMP